jgi:phospholipase D-like protein
MQPHGAEMPLAFGSLAAAGLSVAGILAVALAVSACVSLTRNPRLSSTARLMWFAIVVLLPIFGSIVYFSVRGDW